MQKGYLAAGVLWGFLLFSATAQAAIIGSQTGSSTLARYDGGGGGAYSYTMDLPDVFSGTLKSFELYIAVEGCNAANFGNCGQDVASTFANLALILNCGGTGENASMYLATNYSGIPRSNTRDDAQVPVLTRFTWLPGSGSSVFGYSGSGYPVLSGCTNGSLDAALVPVNASGVTTSNTTVKLLGNAAGAPYFVGYDTVGAPPVISAVSIVSSNSASSTLAKADDVITLSFTSDVAVQTPAVTIAGRDATVASSTNPNSFTASTTALVADSGSVTFSITALSLTGDNSVAVIATDDHSAVTFDNTPPAITITSGPAGGSVSTSSPTEFAFTIDAGATA
ncbi:MAG: hypothetical protein AAB919_01915, partial [Patescibacteria group bacterium]